MQHEMAVAKQQSEAWRKALDGVPEDVYKRQELFRVDIQALPSVMENSGGK